MRKVCLVAGATSLLACGKVLDVPTDAAIDSPPTDVAIDGPLPKSRLYAFNAAQFDISQVSKISLEVVDLTDLTFIRNVDLGFAGLAAGAISPDGTVAYVADFASGEVRFHDTTTGMPTRGAIAVPGVRDLALNADGSILYAASNLTIAAIDTAAGTVTSSPVVGTANGITLTLALSPDGARIATATNDATIALVRTSDLSIEASIPIVTNVQGCASQPAAVAFRSNGLLITWDLNCDALYQVDVGTRTQLVASSIATGRDGGTSFQAANKLTFSNSTGLAYAIKEDGPNNLAVMNAQNATFTTLANADLPFSSVMSEDGSNLFLGVVHRFNGGGADTITTVGTATSVVTVDAYTLSIATQSVSDLTIVTSL